MILQQSTQYPVDESVAYIISEREQIRDLHLSKSEIEFAMRHNKPVLHVNSYFKSSFIVDINDKEGNFRREELRRSGHTIQQTISDLGIKSINIVNLCGEKLSLALAEGIALSAYKFDKYLTKKGVEPALERISIVDDSVATNDISELNAVICGTCLTRDIVNEPLSHFTAKDLGHKIEQLGKTYGFGTEILDKKQIESLKMGGLLAVNKGSVEPPTFSILQYKHAEAKNAAPIVLVGKGIVFDTGGINLKPANSLTSMKSDKAGAAAVIGTFVAVAAAKLPVNIVGLIPATENRPGNNAYVPDDIITMYDGTTVEITNTDAEGRLILADALAYAQKFNPELVIDLATLTGAAIVALGDKIIAVMGNNDNDINDITTAGFNVWERMAALPLWDDYNKLLKSEVADMQNCGPRQAGTIVAGKFLEHFTNYRWLHLDIAGPAFTEKEDSYRGNGATGTGVRLLFDFLRNRSL